MDTEKNFQNIIFRCRVLLHERQFRAVLTFFEGACFSFILHSEVSSLLFFTHDTFFLHISMKIFRHKQIFSLKKTQKSERPYFPLFAVKFLVFLSSNPNNFNNLQKIRLGYDYSL